MAYLGVVWVDEWAVAVAADAEGEAAWEPAVVVTNHTVVAVNATARELGIVESMREKAARRIFPQLRVYERHEEYEALMVEKLVTCASRFASHYCYLGEGAVAFLADRVMRYDGGDMYACMDRIRELYALDDIAVEVGCGEGVAVAVCAAMRNHVVEPNGGDAYLALWPLRDVLTAVRPLLTGVSGGRILSAIDPHDRIANADIDGFLDTCQMLGIRTVGQLMALGQGAVVARFEGVGQRMWDLFCGRGPQLHMSAAPPMRFLSRVLTDISADITSSDALFFDLRAHVDSFAATLDLRGTDIQRLDLYVHTRDGQRLEHTWHSGRISGAQEIFDCVCAQLIEWRTACESGIEGIEIRGSDFIVAQLTPSLWGTTRHAVPLRGVRRLETLLGPRAVCRIGAPGGRSPLATYTLSPWAAAGTSLTIKGQDHWPGSLPPPWPVQHVHWEAVFLDDAGHPCRPDRFGGYACTQQCDDPWPTHLQIAGPARGASHGPARQASHGPARECSFVSHPWWHHGTWWRTSTERTYVHAWAQAVDAHTGEVFLLSFDGRWYVRGVYV